jgi:hypothetical protein
MKWVRYLLLVVCVGSLSCSSDGGPVGTGISSTSAISGNVVDVQTSTAISGSNNMPAALPQIRVSLDQFSDVTTTTDSSGNFMLSGNFAGTMTLRFTVPQQFQVTQQLDVPSGSTIVLQDIELQPDGVVAQAARQLGFFGTVNLVDCTGGTLRIHERRSDGMQFLVQLDDQTSYVDATGANLDCADIHMGTMVTVEGTIDYATDPQMITALVVTISPLPPPPPQAQFEVRFTGAVAALDCSAGLVVVDDSVQRTRLKLASPATLTCKDLQIGDQVQGRGQIALGMPGVIVATQLHVTGPPTSGQLLRFVGFVMMVDCPSGALQLRDGGTTIDVQITPITVIDSHNGPRLTCADIQLGDRIAGFGQLAPDASGTLEAVQITVNHHGMGNPFGP